MPTTSRWWRPSETGRRFSARCSTIDQTSPCSTCDCRRRSPTKGCWQRSRLAGRCRAFPILVLSQYVEPLYARELLSDQRGGVGYLLKDRVMDVGQFVDAVRRVAAGGTVMDPEVVSQLLAKRARDVPLGRLTPREREVLALMAEGRSNAAVAAGLVVSEKAVSKHIANIFMKLDLPPVRRRQSSGAGRAHLPELLRDRPGG